MAGYNSTTFGHTEQAIYTGTLASALQLANASDVSILSVSDVAAPPAGRRLAQSSAGVIRVEFEVVSPVFPSLMVTRVQAVSDDASGLESALQSAGLALPPGSLSVEVPALKVKTPPVQSNFSNAAAAASYYGNLASVVSTGAVVPTDQAVTLVSQLTASLNATSATALSPADAAVVQTAILSTITALASSSSDGLPPQQAVAFALQVADSLSPALLAALPPSQAANITAATLSAAVNLSSSSAGGVSVAQMNGIANACATTLNDPDSPLAADPARAASLRASVLEAMVTQSGAGTAETTAVGLNATAGAVASLLSNTSQIDTSAATHGLAILASVAAAGIDSRALSVSSATASSVTAGLSAIATASGVNASGVDAPSVLPAISLVVDNLAASLTVGMDPGSAPVVVTSPAISMRVDVVALSASSRLFAAGTSLPGSAAAVAPLPAGVPGATAVASQFVAYGFDPNANASSPGNSSGVVVLAFCDPTTLAPLPVAGLGSLITLTLPSGRVGTGAVAAPSFWNESAQAYSAAGLAWIPNPAPPAAQLTIDWVPGFNATSDDVLPLAWNLSGPAAEGCTDVSLDCGSAEGRARVVDTCPGDAASQRWACGSRAAGVIRVWAGCACSLWRVPVDAPPPACGWNVSTQAFQGSGCVTSNTTRVGTRHLTAFTVQASPPEIRTLSAADLVAITPADLVHAKDLLIIVTVLFGGMHALSWLLARLDARDFAHLKAAAYSPAMGATRITPAASHSGDAVSRKQLLLKASSAEDTASEAEAVELWTWRFTQNDLVLDEASLSGVVSGSAVRFAAMVGLPYARLACAVPSCYFGGAPTRHCVGRAEGLSPDRLHALASRRFGKLAARSFKSAGQAEEEPPLSQQQAPARVDQLTLASTALMHALLVSWCVESAETIVEQQRAFVEHFCPRRGVETAALARRFLRLYVCFKEMLIAGTLRGARNWLPKARMWRAILLAREEQGEGGGVQCFWEPDEHIAFTLLANNATPPPAPLGGLMALLAALSEFSTLLLTGLATGDAGSASDGASAAAATLDSERALVHTGHSRKVGSAVVAGAATEVPAASLQEATAAWDEQKVGSEALPKEELSTADDASDPLSFSAAAILDTMPAELRAAMASHDALLAGRVWATMLVAAYMEATALFAWRVTSHRAPASQQRTLVDAAQAWVSSRLAGAVPSGCPRRLVLAARAHVARWAVLHERRTTRSRSKHIVTVEHATLRTLQAASTVHGAACNGHPTASLFLSELCIGFTRWQGMNILVSGMGACCPLPTGILTAATDLCLWAHSLLSCHACGQHLAVLLQGRRLLRRTNAAGLSRRGPAVAVPASRLCRRHVCGPHGVGWRRRAPRGAARRAIHLGRLLCVHRLPRGRQPARLAAVGSHLLCGVTATLRGGRQLLQPEHCHG